MGAFEKTVFINCPFDDDYEPLLQAAIFCFVYLGFEPLLANVSLESGSNRLSKIINMMKRAKYSVHDLSLHRAIDRNEVFRMNMPFELGLDSGIRETGKGRLRQKKFLILEHTRFDLKAALSDIAGQDPQHHNGNYSDLIRLIRDFIRAESANNISGRQAIQTDYETWQAWVVEKKISEGHSEEDAIKLPTKERIDEMKAWIRLGKPAPMASA